MSQVAVSLSDRTYRKLRELAEHSKRSIEEELERLVEDQHRRWFWEQVNAGYAALRADPAAWQEELAERRLWEATLMDGLDPSERWGPDGTPLPPENKEETR
jgi:hypothetical protein